VARAKLDPYVLSASRFESGRWILPIFALCFGILAVFIADTPPLAGAYWWMLPALVLSSASAGYEWCALRVARDQHDTARDIPAHSVPAMGAGGQRGAHDASSRASPYRASPVTTSHRVSTMRRSPTARPRGNRPQRDDGA
jgi:hypothetical protein